MLLFRCISGIAAPPYPVPHGMTPFEPGIHRVEFRRWTVRVRITTAYMHFIGTVSTGSLVHGRDIRGDAFTAPALTSIGTAGLGGLHGFLDITTGAARC